MFNFHSLPVAVRQALLDLIEALDVNHTTCRTGGSDDGGGQTVEDASNVQNHLDDVQQRIVKELCDGVQIWIVEIDTVNAG